MMQTLLKNSSTKEGDMLARVVATTSTPPSLTWRHLFASLLSCPRRQAQLCNPILSYPILSSAIRSARSKKGTLREEEANAYKKRRSTSSYRCKDSARPTHLHT
eukprot:1143372-Pelagomonas_calceolata.AAC.1